MIDFSEDDGELGPAMAALPPRRQAFVRAVVALGRNGVENFTEAARIAGFSDNSDNALRVRAHALSHDHRIQAALLEEARRTINLSAAVVATPVVVAIAMDEGVTPRDRLRACEMLFNRGGMPALTEHKVTVDDRRPKSMVELATRLAAELGVDPGRLIGVNRAAATVIEGEFTEVVGEPTADR